VYREEPPVKKAPLPSSSSTVGFLPPEKKAQHGRDRRGKDFIVVALLIFFMAVAIVMMALYFSRDSQDEKVTENGEQTVNIILLISVVLKERLETREGESGHSRAEFVFCHSTTFPASRPRNANI